MSKNYNAQYLSDYRPPDYRIISAHLNFVLHDEHTMVSSILTIERVGSDPNLKLDGELLELIELKLDGHAIQSNEYKLDASSLTLSNVPNKFELAITTKIFPHQNLALTGLYRSKNNYCTQCEAHGFRRITYFLDRPDNLTEFTTMLEGDRKTLPILLSNGNLVDQGVKGDRHWVKWHDPFLKPSYLFALVAGDLACVEDTFTTMTGRIIVLKIYVEHGNEYKCTHAMTSLKKSMKWDEQMFGREYDLDIFMIVAVSDFNMGAMENKGLNIFNDKYILADPKSATDADYLGIESVVAHEYFHNWTGNRITCRDWFQLSLKEGLTVYRDQEFSRDLNSRVVNRIEDVARLKEFQFKEDAGPNAHPVQPNAYIEVNNFYTATVYEKGAELIRMQETIVGKLGFRKGMDLYFQRHDGQAVTIEDFVSAIADANDIDLSGFMGWYKQAGTPVLSVKVVHNPESAVMNIYFKQTIPPTPTQPNKATVMIPIRYAVFSSETGAVFLNNDLKPENLFILEKSEDSIEITGVTEKPILSVLREFSAPVKLDYTLSFSDRLILLAHDTDGVNRYEICQSIYRDLMKQALTGDFSWNSEMTTAFSNVVEDEKIDHALRAKILAFPSLGLLMQDCNPIDVGLIAAARKQVLDTLIHALDHPLRALMTNVKPSDIFSLSFDAMAKRSIWGMAAHLLASQRYPDIGEMLFNSFKQASNMTDEMSCFKSLVWYFPDYREEVIDHFYSRWHEDHLVLDKWFSVQAMIPEADNLVRVKALMNHKAFSLKNPNKVRSLISAFANFNPLAFHHELGDGYRFVGDVLRTLDSMNPQVASRLASVFENWKRFVSPLKENMLSEIDKTLALPNLSKDVHEILSKSKA